MMGDDVHMRSQATTNLLLRTLLPYLVGLQDPRAAEVARFLSANHLFFLNIGKLVVRPGWLQLRVVTYILLRIVGVDFVRADPRIGQQKGSGHPGIGAKQRSVSTTCLCRRK